MTIEEIIRQRKSVRTFNPEHKIEPEKIEALNKVISSTNTPFGGGYTIKLKQFNLKGPQKPGTYGVISGAGWYLLMAIDTSLPLAPLAAGFAMEHVVLKATELGLGTCWMALTFNATDFENSTTFPKGEKLKIISPVGYPAPKRKLLESLTRITLGSDNRLPMNKLFSEGQFGQPVLENNVFFNALQMMRLAPSAKNSQPWRAIVIGNEVYFYYIKKSEASMLDLGIALCHFASVLDEEGKVGIWETDGNFTTHPNYIPVVKFTLTK